MALPCECHEIVGRFVSGHWSAHMAKAWECPRCGLIWAVPDSFPSNMIVARPMIRRDLLPWKTRVPGRALEGELTTIKVAETDGEIYALVSFRGAPDGERDAIRQDMLRRAGQSLMDDMGDP